MNQQHLIQSKNTTRTVRGSKKLTWALGTCVAISCLVPLCRRLTVLRCALVRLLKVRHRQKKTWKILYIVGGGKCVHRCCSKQIHRYKRWFHQCATHHQQPQSRFELLPLLVAKLNQYLCSQPSQLASNVAKFFATSVVSNHKWQTANVSIVWCMIQSMCEPIINVFAFKLQAMHE